MLTAPFTFEAVGVGDDGPLEVSDKRGRETVPIQEFQVDKSRFDETSSIRQCVFQHRHASVNSKSLPIKCSVEIIVT
jgi:hypothetical protein